MDFKHSALKKMIMVRVMLFSILFILYPNFLHAQMVNIQGTVTSEDNESLPGVNIVIKGTTIGALTDIEGRYSIQAAPEDILIFSFIGYSKKEIPVGSQQIIDVVLETSLEAIEEVVVVGYGTQKKESVVGAISQTTGSEIQRMNAPDIANALTGMIPGLITVQTTGIPGGSSAEDAKTKIFIRGLSTWNGGQPLMLVDGVERSIQDVDPNEIQTMSVLKDASATAVFGVKGANGVILITTKRGGTSKPKISFEGQTSISEVSKIYLPLGSYEANMLKNMAIINELNTNQSGWAAITPLEKLEYYRDQTYPQLYPDVNWYDEMTRDFASAYKMNLNVSGGSKYVSYFSSISYLHEGDIMKGEDLGQGYIPGYRYNRFNVRSNLDFKITKTTKLSVNLSGIYGAQDLPRAGAKSIWWGVYGHPPDTHPIQYQDGIYGDYDGFQFRNSYTALNFGGQEKYNRSQIQGDLIFEQKLDFVTKGLSFSAKASVDNYFETQGPTASGVSIVSKYILPSVLDASEGEDLSKYTVWDVPSTGENGYSFVEDPVQYNSERITGTNDFNRQLFYQLSMNYARSFDRHSITGLALMNRTESAKGSDFLRKREDWVGRLTYNFDSRYYLEFNGAYNGSEKFDREYRFGFFPSFGVVWMASNEDFFRNALSFINIFRIRYSRGKVGSDSGVERWLYLENWIIDPNTWMFGEPYIQPSGYPMYFEGNTANPDARWETAIKNNIGLETGFLKNRLKLNFDYWWEHRVDMLIRARDRTSNVIYGTELPSANLGEVKTNGYEIEASYNYSSSRQWTLNPKFTFGYANDLIIERDDPPLKPDYQKLAGHQIGQLIDHRNTDIYQTWDQIYGSAQWDNKLNTMPGDLGVVDYNADGRINEDDKVPVGYPERPQYNYSMSLGGSYKGFRASVMFYGVFNVNRLFGWPEFAQGYSIVYPHHMQSWSPEMQNVVNPDFRALRYNTLNNQIMNGSQNLMDASYLRLQNAEIAYDFGLAPWINRMGLANLSLYLRGNNLFIWTDMYEDRDANGSSNGSGQGNRSYPLLRRFTAGLIIGF